MQKNNGVVSVVIPCKSDEYLNECIVSLNRQKVRLQIILVLDTQEKLKINKKYLKNVEIVINKGIHHPGPTRNVGLKLAKGKYVAFLDSDDYWERDFLSKSIEMIKKDSKTVGTLCFSRKVFMPGFSVFSKFKLHIYNWLKDILTIFNGDYLNPTAPYLCQISHMLFDRNKLEKIVFDPKMKFCEDWDYVLKALKIGKIGIMYKRLVCFRYSPRSNTFSQSKRSLDNKYLYYNRLVNKITKAYGGSIYLKLFNFYIQNLLIRNA